ncbi:hypothetical protein EJ05DRAFT_425160, partial [Pseudovirgaria hyperparasitica]
IAFKYAQLWPVVSGRIIRPFGAGITELHADVLDWDAKDNKAMIMLLSSIHQDLVIGLTSCDTAAAAWTYLSSRFDRDTGNSSIHLF